MTRKEAIADLIAKVEAEKFNAAINAAEGIWGTYHRNPNLVYASYRGSLSGAESLHESVLPDNCYWWVERRPDGQFQSGVTVGNLGKTFQSFSDNPARACSWRSSAPYTRSKETDMGSPQSGVPRMTDHARMIAELARARVLFQQRAIVAVIDDTPNAKKPAPDGTGCKPADDGV